MPEHHEGLNQAAHLACRQLVRATSISAMRPNSLAFYVIGVLFHLMKAFSGFVKRYRSGHWQLAARATIFAFGIAALVGAGLLMTPWSATSGDWTSPIDALFTSVSALCVTGLTALDTETYWSVFGQVVILCLMQTGGLGVMTLGCMLGEAIARKISLKRKVAVASATGMETVSGTRVMLRRIAVMSFGIEAVAALVLALRWYFSHDLSIGKAVWFGVFHSVSAFNNAGFALYTMNLVPVQTDSVIILVICVEVILGGLGFPVLLELSRRFRWPRKWVLNTKLVISGTVLLLVLGTIVFAILEWRNEGTLGPMSIKDKLVNAFGMSVFPRTAGFATVDVAQMHSLSWAITDVLMFVGGGTAGTAGGVKIATVAILLVGVHRQLTNAPYIAVFRRQIPDSVGREATTVLTLALLWVVGATAALMVFTPYDLDRCVYEVLSGFGTVGLSTGITPFLNSAAKITLVLTMFVGRIGPVTLGAAMATSQSDKLYELPIERPLIG